MVLQNCHRCSIISNWRKLCLVLGAGIYCSNTVLDLRVARYMYKEGDTIWGSSLLCISFLSLVMTNGASQSKRFDRKFRYLPAREDGAFSIDASMRRNHPIRRYMAPWEWNSPFHCFLNALSCLQLNPVIDALEVLFHKKQSFRSILLKYAHYKATRKMDKVLESSLLVTVQTISLVRFISKETSPDLHHYYQLTIRVVSLLVSSISLAYIVATEERARRFAELLEYDMMLGCGIQPAILFLGYFFIYVSRILFVSIVYYFFHNNSYSESINYLTVIAVESHHWIIFIVYLVYTLKSNTVIDKRRPIWMLIPIFYILSVTEIFIVNLRFPVRSVGIALQRNSGKSLGHRSGAVFGSVYALFGIELLAVLVASFTSVQTTSLKLITESCLYASLTLYLLSAALFFLYFHPRINPDARQEKHPHKDYMTSLVPLICDTSLHDLRPLTIPQTSGTSSYIVPDMFTAFMVADGNSLDNLDVSNVNLSDFVGSGESSDRDDDKNSKGEIDINSIYITE